MQKHPCPISTSLGRPLTTGNAEPRTWEMRTNSSWSLPHGGHGFRWSHGQSMDLGVDISYPKRQPPWRCDPPETEQSGTMRIYINININVYIYMYYYIYIYTLGVKNHCLNSLLGKTIYIDQRPTAHFRYLLTKAQISSSMATNERHIDHIQHEWSI